MQQSPIWRQMHPGSPSFCVKALPEVVIYLTPGECNSQALADHGRWSGVALSSLRGADQRSGFPISQW